MRMIKLIKDVKINSIYIERKKERKERKKEKNKERKKERKRKINK